MKLKLLNSPWTDDLANVILAQTWQPGITIINMNFQNSKQTWTFQTRFQSYRIGKHYLKQLKTF